MHKMEVINSCVKEADMRNEHIVPDKYHNEVPSDCMVNNNNIDAQHHERVETNESFLVERRCSLRLKNKSIGDKSESILSGDARVKKRTKLNPILQQQTLDKAWVAGGDSDASSSIGTSLFVFDEIDLKGILIIRESLRLANRSRIESNEVDKSLDPEKCPPSIPASKYFLEKLQRLAKLGTDKVHYAQGKISREFFDSPILACKDLSGGQEAIPIIATNMYDNPLVVPTGFKYIKSIQVARSVEVPPCAGGCKCIGSCMSCSCARLNGTKFPYTLQNGGRLTAARDILFECGTNCGCGPDCRNRISQMGLKYRLEVHRTLTKGWAVKTWDFIPSDSPVFEYVGVLSKIEDLDPDSTDTYVFEIDCLQTINEVEGRKRRLGSVSLPASICANKNDNDDTMENVPEFCIDAGSFGNVARFVNHSCEPNLFVQCVLSSYNDIRFARIVLFAGENISPYQELTCDYNYKLDSVIGPDGKIKQLPCHCGAAKCRKRLY